MPIEPSGLKLTKEADTNMIFTYEVAHIINLIVVESKKCINCVILLAKKKLTSGGKISTKPSELCTSYTRPS